MEETNEEKIKEFADTRKIISPMNLALQIISPINGLGQIYHIN